LESLPVQLALTSCFVIYLGKVTFNFTQYQHFLMLSSMCCI